MANKKIPNKPRYDYVKRTARKLLLSSNICSLPVDIDLIYKNNGIILLSENEAEQIAMSEIPKEFKLNNGIQAITQYRIIQGKTVYITIYKENKRVPGNVRFSKAHELGHIFLGHFEEYELPTSFNMFNSHEYWVLEREAEIFAAELLAPTAILRACNCFDKKSIKILCNLSDEASEYVLNDIGRDYHLMESDKAALECKFDDFIRNKKYLLLTSTYFCLNCGSPFISKDKHCRMCGSNMRTTKTSNNNVFICPSSIPLKPTGRVYFCMKCGESNLPITATNCIICDTSLYNFCCDCNIKLSGDDRYCFSCGGKSIFYKEGILEDWTELQKSKNIIPINHTHGLRRVNCWEYILDKLLSINKIEIYKLLYGSYGYDDCGKLIVALSHNKICLIEKELILKEINSISLPYFDITYDAIDIIVM